MRREMFIYRRRASINHGDNDARRGDESPGIKRKQGEGRRGVNSAPPLNREERALTYTTRLA